MLYWIIIGVLIVGIIAVIFFTVSKLLKEKKDYNQFERRYHSREDDYDDDYDDDDDEEDDYEPEPRRRPVRQQSERRTSSAPAKRRWKIVLEDVDQQDQYSFIFYDSLGIGKSQCIVRFSDKFLCITGRSESCSNGALCNHPKVVTNCI